MPGREEEIEVESHWHWYDPTTWGEEDTSPNLMEWLQANQAAIWAQLYGSLPYSLRE